MVGSGCYERVGLYLQKFTLSMKKIPAVTVLFCLLTIASFAQPTPATIANNNAGGARAKLVIGLMVDQMRWDYLYRYNKLYSSGGFKRLLTQGYSFENTMIPYTPTYTAPGHACVYTGSVPAIHGIVGNNWFNKESNSYAYCTGDSTVATVGSGTNAGKMSPANLWTTTVGDELKLSNNFKSKVIGISLKDRGAILPAGHSADAAYWYDDAVGKFITSTYYLQELPAWVNQFNRQDLAGNYMSKDWNTLYPINKYVLSSRDSNAFEVPIPGERAPVFPHKLSAIANGKYSSFKYTPYASTYSFDFAKAAIDGENLGAGAATDILALSISATDYIGHNFGPNSIEIEDTYYRLDKDIADFLIYLDKKIGKNNYLLFLTADHGVAHVPAFLSEHKIPGGTFDDGPIIRELNSSLAGAYGVENIIQGGLNYQFYLDLAKIEKAGKDLAGIKATIIKKLKTQPYIVAAFETSQLATATLTPTQKQMMVNGYNPVRSGDIMYTVKPGYFDGGTKGTTHGLWNPYDAHIPNVWFGWGIKAGRSHRETFMTDIAPTISALLKIQAPNGNVGKVLEEIVR